MSEDKKLVTIIVSGTAHEWPKTEITYAEVVKLFDPSYTEDSQINYSVEYERGHGEKPEGILSRGGSVKVKDRMVFNVSRTGLS